MNRFHRLFGGKSPQPDSPSPTDDQALAPQAGEEIVPAQVPSALDEEERSPEAVDNGAELLAQAIDAPSATTTSPLRRPIVPAPPPSSPLARPIIPDEPPLPDRPDEVPLPESTETSSTTSAADLMEATREDVIDEGTPQSDAAPLSPAPAVAQPTSSSALSVEQDEPAGDEAAKATPAASDAPAQEEIAVLANGSTVGERYVLLHKLTVDEIQAAVVPLALAYYLAYDREGYRQCWSCGSQDNDAGMRFCQTCGAGLTDHQFVLVQTEAPSSTPGAVVDGAFCYYPLPERRQFGAAGISLSVAGYSAEGPHIPNEDSYWFATSTLCSNSVRQSLAVIVLADGMGGYTAGSGLISRPVVVLAGETLWNALAPIRLGQDGATLSQIAIEAMLRQAIAAANEHVINEILAQGHDMGSTLIVTTIVGDTIYVANIGDSRAYYISPTGDDLQITEDQSDVAERVRQGLLHPDDFYTAPGGNIILHAMGEPQVETAAGLSSQPLEPSSYILLCCDGYWKTERGIPRATRTLADSPSLEEAARAMVTAALDRGSDDNTTVVLVQIRG